MYFFRDLKKIFFVIILVFLQIIFVVNSQVVFSLNNSRQSVSRYFEDKFEITVPALPTEYDNLSSNLEDVSIEIKDGKIIISDLVPDQVYNDVKITFNDNLGRKYELEFDNVITSQPVKPDNKFVYDAYGNGLGRKPDHLGFKYWYNRLDSFDITAVDFIMEMVTSDEFNSVYKTADEKIKALYKTIVGREAEEEGFIYWMLEFSILVDDMGLTDRQAILELVKRMIMSDEFKDLVEEAGFLYIRE
ncbi:DUF4214 domain-containing protein [Candidatus Arthromitus sp. SFB-turkey]|uniref:DUF4214 domain-containing protein n=1 Tax=Candidatus Arthromitus sp. SFB-turkey TaxID=1840217 RepID=UPI0007F39492|nr:DUF4214 domain-containing protein [Candidatus Arthromitus sp. SFB-turkey]OAT88046.1 hypothetical protein A6P36_02545 [Candidatus Arthromitus sp. SFB-turkey]HJD00003.1 DUF4214 domain-containing protein [Candidatus Dwaynia gallinarum]